MVILEKAFFEMAFFVTIALCNQNYIRFWKKNGGKKLIFTEGEVVIFGNSWS